MSLRNATIEQLTQGGARIAAVDGVAVASHEEGLRRWRNEPRNEWIEQPSASKQAKEAAKAGKAQSTDKRRGNQEQQEQIALFQWRDLKLSDYPELKAMFAIPNHGKRSRIAGHFEVMAGLTRGASDVCLPVPRRGYNALFIEMKVGNNKATPAQLAFQATQRELGAYCCVAWGWAAAISVIYWYIGAQIVCRVDEKWEVR